MSNKRKRRWFNFSLKTLLVVMTAIAIVLGFYIKSFRDKREAIAAIQELSAWISYEKGGPQWLRKFVRDEKYFWNPIAIRFNTSRPMTNAELKSAIDPMMEFDNLTYVSLYRSKISDSGLAELLPLADKLESLDIRNTKVTDNSIANLTQFHRLSLLRLQDSGISSDGVDELRKALPSCKFE
jgi:hypothetical protein